MVEKLSGWLFGAVPTCLSGKHKQSVPPRGSGDLHHDLWLPTFPATQREIRTELDPDATL